MHTGGRFEWLPGLNFLKGLFVFLRALIGGTGEIHGKDFLIDPALHKINYLFVKEWLSGGDGFK